MPLTMPDGNPASSIDKVMLLAMWSRKLSEEKHATRPPIIAAGMGKPTFPISQFAAGAGIDYWHKSQSRSQQARHIPNSRSDATARNRIAKILAAIDYGDSQGDFEARSKMAATLTRWYGLTIEPQHVLYTVGGAGALHAIFNFINKQIPNGLIVTPFPHYSLYAGAQGKNRLFPVPVMKEKGYKLTAELLSKSLKAATEQAKKEGTKISAVLICDPNNPLGTALTEGELQEIARVLKDYPDVPIILDEAYAEMRLSGKHQLSLLTVAPELKDRIILMRSATKALSAAGERMAVTVTFNDKVMASLRGEGVNVHGPTPRSLQHVFAEAMEKLDEIELNNLRDFYRPQVEYCSKRVQRMGAGMPDPEYATEGTFYVVADLRDLFGQEISADAERALGKRGKISTDEELIYSLLFDNGVAIAPLSYFGMSNRGGYVRITCSGGDEELAELMNRVENRLAVARKEKQAQFMKQLRELVDQLTKFNKAKAAGFTKSAMEVLAYQSTPQNVTALALKKSNAVLQKLISSAKVALSTHNPRLKHTAATCIQSFFRGNRGRKQAKQWKDEMDSKWRAFVDIHFGPTKGKQAYHWSPSERLESPAWKEYLRKNNLPAESKEKQAPHKTPPSLPRSKL